MATAWKNSCFILSERSDFHMANDLSIAVHALSHKPYKSSSKQCWRSKKELISDVLWTPTHGHTSDGWPAKNHIHQFYVDIRCHLEDLLSTIGMDGEIESKGSMLLACLGHEITVLKQESWNAERLICTF